MLQQSSLLLRPHASKKSLIAHILLSCLSLCNFHANRMEARISGGLIGKENESKAGTVKYPDTRLLNFMVTATAH
jgi:hypothetical protein